MAQQGASGGLAGNSKTRNPSENGKRKPRKNAVSEVGKAIQASDSGRSDTESKGSQSQRKRARRRNRKIRATNDTAIISVLKQEFTRKIQKYNLCVYKRMG